MAISGQAVSGRNIFFNLASVVDWRVITAAKQRQVEIDNVRENSRQVTHDYAIGDQVYVEMTGIYHKLDYNKQEPYRTTDFLTNGTVWLKQGQLNEKINIKLLNPHFDEYAYNRCP